MRTRLLQLALGLALAVSGVVLLHGQVLPTFGSRRVVPGVLPAERTGFTFCRLVYTSTYREPSGSGWNTDYPTADQNLMIRLSELTRTGITRFEDGSPAHALVNASDAALFQCPFLYAVDAGVIGWRDPEVVALREYLLKGGFLWVDDYWGDLAWANWVRQISRVLPEYEIVELPMDHPIFSTFYTVQKVPQIPSISSWRRSGGATSERGAETERARVLGISDERGRLLVLMSHNTDIADAWEREAEDPAFFHLFSPYGYAVGINIAIWAMSH
jgi:hypothetical protein